MYGILIIYLDGQFTEVSSDTVKILRLEHISESGADVVYILNGAYVSSHYWGKIPYGSSNTEATVVRDVSKNMRGIERITLRDIEIPKDFIK